jgi:precorrin-3B synthase
MSSWEIKGWCPGALRPMQSGDGLVVRIRPPMGRLTPAQAEAIGRVALTHGNGIIDLSARANLQLRGVTDTSHAALIEDLGAEGLIDPDIETESLRNLIVTPFRGPPPTPALPHEGGREAPGPSVVSDAEGQRLPTPSWAGDGGSPSALQSIDALAALLAAALAKLPRLPGKFGFAVDAGPAPVLSGASADIRLERSADGRLILRPDGHGLGREVTDPGVDVIAMAEWFVRAGGVTDGRGRMAALVGRGVVPPGCNLAPANPMPVPPAGPCPDGVLVALAFGQMRAETLRTLAALGHEIRPTPWRMLLLVGARGCPDLPGVITDPADPLLRVIACTGAPGCPQARGDTRGLARQLAPHVAMGRSLHLSGCAKGCAHPGPSDLVLTATERGYDLIRGGSASDVPDLTGLSPTAALDHMKALNAPSL